MPDPILSESLGPDPDPVSEVQSYFKQVQADLVGHHFLPVQYLLSHVEVE